ncbi:MAG: hypothetical protein M1820_007323 [Bogoriella megaspora]|nr:MAG: hypothetical protein M1820_007323 [Bogoriella megaspora]
MRLVTLIPFLALPVLALAGDGKYSPCPLLRGYFSPPTINRTSSTFTNFSTIYTAEFDNLIATGSHPVYGPITSNTTSFSIILSTGAADNDDPVFFEYHYTAPGAEAPEPVSSDTVFPAGSLTQVLTVYAWLATLGDDAMTMPITHFLPELLGSNLSAGSDFPIFWDDITIGALAGQTSGLNRDSGACTLGAACNWGDFLNVVKSQSPLFLPDTTPINSNIAFQLLAFALEHEVKNASYAQILQRNVFGPSNMTRSGLLGDVELPTFGGKVDGKADGEPGALSFLTTTTDLGRWGAQLLAGTSLPPALLRRWLQPASDTSNRANAVGRPWEIFHKPVESGAGTLVIDAFTKNGMGIQHYASYFGLTPDLGVAFAILAHDTEGDTPDLNVHADILAEAIGDLADVAARQMAGGSDRAVLNVTDGLGIVVEELVVDGADVLADIAGKMGLAKAEDLDMRLYPTNMLATKGKGQQVRQFLAVYQDKTALVDAVYQDKTALVDAGTPTCITWQGVGELGNRAVERVMFEVGDDRIATRMWVDTVPGTVLSKEA